MKKVKLSNKVQLEREIILKLTEAQLKEIEGGKAPTISTCWGGFSCYPPKEEKTSTNNE